MLDNPQSDFGVSKEEVDKLYSDYENGSLDQETSEMAPQEGQHEDAPVNDEQQAAPEAPKEAALPQAPKEAEFEFTHNGRAIKAPLSQILKWAQQGYDYPQKMAELNRQREQFKTLEQYAPIDEWVRNNPDKWDKLQAAIKAEQEGYGDLPPNNPILQKLSKVESFMNELETKQRTEKEQQEDAALDAEIRSIQEKYKDLDWKTADSNGRTRELAVIEHATRNGIKSFKTAFLDLYHDELQKIAETKALERIAAQKEANAKKGLLPNKEAPVRLKPPAPKSKNYESTESILEELGLT